MGAGHWGRILKERDAGNRKLGGLVPGYNEK
jgi:hypothetical protein